MWDRFNQQGKYVAIGGLDAHASIISRYLNIKLPSYEKLFKSLRTHVLTPSLFTGEFDHDSTLLYTALRNGNCYISYDYLADATGVQFMVVNGGNVLMMGQEHKFNEGSRFVVSCGRIAAIRILRDGRCIMEKTTQSIEVSVPGPGVYRAEFYLHKMPWIYTNPIYLRS
jgi:hypothetical protein